MYEALRILHILGGGIALISGLVPIFSKKGGKLHILFGRIFFGGMTAVFFTAIPMSILKSNWFLFSVAIFSYYAVFSGWRHAIRKGKLPNLLDKIYAWVTIVTGVLMVFLGGYVIINSGNMMGLVLIVFGLFAFLMSFDDSRFFNGERQSKRFGKMRWFFGHFQRIGGGYIATVTAFLVTNFSIDFQYILWLAPAAIGTILISRSTRFYQKKFSKSS